MNIFIWFSFQLYSFRHTMAKSAIEYFCRHAHHCFNANWDTITKSAIEYFRRRAQLCLNASWGGTYPRYCVVCSIFFNASCFCHATAFACNQTWMETKWFVGNFNDFFKKTYWRQPIWQKMYEELSFCWWFHFKTNERSEERLKYRFILFNSVFSIVTWHIWFYLLTF